MANRWSPITIVAAITSQFGAALYPTEVRINAPEGGLAVDSVVLLNQIRSIDRKRLVRRIGTVKSDTMNRVDKALCISFGVVKFIRCVAGQSALLVRNIKWCRRILQVDFLEMSRQTAVLM